MSTEPLRNITFPHFEEALERLETALQVQDPSELEQEGLVRRMSFAIDAGWKALRSLLEALGTAPGSPTPPAVLAAAWRQHLIFNGELWMEMLTRRSTLVRDDSPETLHAAVDALRSRFFPELARLRGTLARFTSMEEGQKKNFSLDGAVRSCHRS